MGHRASIEDQLNLFKIVYKLKVSELRKKCKRLKNSENFWLSKHEEMKERMKGLVEQIDKPKNAINNVLIFKAEANLRNNLITNKINNYKNKNRGFNNNETRNLNFNEVCSKLTSEYDEDQITSEIIDANEELEMLYFEQEEPNQQIQKLQKNFTLIESQKNENYPQLDVVMETVENLLKPKAELQKKLQHFKKMNILR